MNSQRIRLTIFGIFLLSVILLTTFGCYTSFSHPSVQDSRWGDVRLGDDCGECHQNSLYSVPILPSAAESDMNWQFYSGSPWWQDDMAITDLKPSESYEGTGARHVESGASYSAPAVMPATTPAVETLGKSDTQEPSDSQPGREANDSRRSVERRTDTTSEDNDEDRDASRTRRK